MWMDLILNIEQKRSLSLEIDRKDRENKVLLARSRISDRINFRGQEEEGGKVKTRIKYIPTNKMFFFVCGY
jgi:hypothetical protein